MSRICPLYVLYMSLRYCQYIIRYPIYVHNIKYCVPYMCILCPGYGRWGGQRGVYCQSYRSITCPVYVPYMAGEVVRGGCTASLIGP